MEIPQVLTSAQCLECRGCCLFRDTGGDWSPRLTPEDAAALLRVSPDGAWQNGTDRIVLHDGAGGKACSFLNTGDHHCRAYGRRPFECRLYPFLLSREKTGFRVYAHLSCPGIDRLRASGAWDRSVVSIREFFSRADVQAYVNRNAPCFPDYSLSHDEVDEVFAFDPSAVLWAERPRIEAALGEASRSLSSLSFINIFAWQEFFRFDVRQIGGNVCVFASQPVGTFMYLPPLGREISSAAVDAAFAYMRELNRGGSLTRIENVAEEDLAAFDTRRYQEQRRGHEYVYRREDIAGLKGSAYKNRRHEVNVFEREHAGAWTWRAYADSDFNACAVLFDRWLDGRLQKHDNEVYRHMLAENRDVHRLLLAHAGRLGLVGRVVVVDGCIAAYTFGYPLNADTFCVLLEVADLSRKGLPAFVFSRFCGDEAFADRVWVNAMDDFEAEGLARTKDSWRPGRMQAVYTVTPRMGQ